jgi:acetyltransferase EpsM
MFVIIGAGGHAKVISDILKANNEKVAGFYDDQPDVRLDGLKHLGKIKDIREGFSSDFQYIIAIGHNRIREKIALDLQEIGVRFGTAVHPSAVIGSDATIGEGTVVMANGVVNHSSAIGSHSIINTAATVDHDCCIGDFVHVSPGAHLAGNVQVGKGTHIGIGSSIIQSLSIGVNVVIGAGSAVIEGIPDNSVAVGCPAKVIKYNK